MAGLLSDSVVVNDVSRSITVLVIQGEAVPVTLSFDDDGVVQDVSAWQFDIPQVQLKSGVLGGDGIPTRLVPLAGNVGQLSIAASSMVGAIYLMVPEDLYTSPIPPNATTGVPVVVAMVRGRRPDGIVDIIRVQIVIKYGIEESS